jgi:hypothetical protein
MVFVERDSSIQVAIGCLINFVMLMASLKIQPIYDPLVDAANNIALLELYLTLFLGLLFRVSAVSDDAGESELFTLVAAALAAFIFVYPAVGMMLFSRRSRTTVTPPKSALAKAVTARLPYVASNLSYLRFTRPGGGRGAPQRLRMGSFAPSSCSMLTRCI